jgi:hypothetical protein
MAAGAVGGGMRSQQPRRVVGVLEAGGELRSGIYHGEPWEVAIGEHGAHAWTSMRRQHHDHVSFNRSG